MSGSKATPASLLAQGMRALESGDGKGAKAALKKTLRAGNATAAAQAAYELGKLAFYEHHLPEALGFFQQAAVGGDTRIAPLGDNGAGVALEHMHRLDEARLEYLKAITSAHGTIGGRAAWNLGRLLDGQNDLEGAASAYERAMGSGDRELEALAALQLGLLREDIGDTAEAEIAFRRALTGPDGSARAEAALGLGHLLAARGDASGAAAVWKLASESDDSDRADTARALLAELTLVSPESRSPQRELPATSGSGAETRSRSFGGVLRRSTVLTPLDEVIALRSDEPGGGAAVLDRFQADIVYALGQATGEVSNGQGTEGDLLHYAADDDEGRTRLPVFTQPRFLRRALARNPEWQSTCVLQVQGGLLYQTVGENVRIVVNPWSRLEYALPQRQPAASGLRTTPTTSTGGATPPAPAS
jgi:tetratricopeptide (TPR) repeat protein